MSKKVTVLVVDESTTDPLMLAAVNDWVENFILNRVIWARTTDQVAVGYCSPEEPFDLVLEPGPATLELFKKLRDHGPAKYKPGEAEAEEGIMQARDLIVAHCKKLKFVKTIIYLGNAPANSTQLQQDLEKEGINLLAFAQDTSELHDFCTEYMPKVVAPYRSFNGVLSLGAEGNRLEMGVKVYTASKPAPAPTFTKVHESTSGSSLDAVATVREKQVEGVPIDDSSLSFGYMYGSELVTVPAALAAEIKKPKVTEGFEIVAFCALDFEACVGDSSYVLPDADESGEIMGALVRSMFYREVVALARYCPPRATTSQMVFLQPYMSADRPDMFLMTPAPMREDLRVLKFGDLASHKSAPTPEMEQAVNDIFASVEADDIEDFIVPDASIDRRMEFIRSIIKGAPTVPEFKRWPEPRDPRLDVLGLEQVVVENQAKDEFDLIADEQELDLEGLLGY